MPRVSVIVPSLDATRDASLRRLKEALLRQTYQDHEFISVVGIRPQGRAINQGAHQAQGEILVIMDDDSSIEDPRLLARLVATLDSDGSIAMAGASVQPPPSAGRFQRWAARELPRFNVPVVEAVTDSDLACHGCAALPARVFREVGGERESLIRGLDPDLRNRLRTAGYRVVLAPEAVVYHPLPATFYRLLATFYRNGRGSAFAQVFHPELAFDTDEALRRRDPAPCRPPVVRAVRLPLRIAWALLTARPIRACVYIAYTVGLLGALSRYWLLRARGGKHPDGP